MKTTKIKAIIGLGNPGEEYEKTYHNAGLMFCDFLINNFQGKEIKKTKFFSTNACHIDGKEIFIIRIHSFMNQSGTSVLKSMIDLNLTNEEIALAHDDSDFEIGKYKFSIDSTSAGHRGVQSVIDLLKTKDFLRIRIGIRKEAGKALDFVLNKLTNEDTKKLENIFEEASKKLIKEFI